MNKKVNTQFLETKIKLYKEEISRFVLARDIIVLLIASAILMADLGAHLHKGTLEQIIIVIYYFYGGLAITHITTRITYKIKKTEKYYNILEKYKYVGVNEEEAKFLQDDLLKLSQNKVYFINLINNLLNTAPVAYFLCLGYYLLLVSGI